MMNEQKMQAEELMGLLRYRGIKKEAVQIAEHIFFTEARGWGEQVAMWALFEAGKLEGIRAERAKRRRKIA